MRCYRYLAGLVLSSSLLAAPAWAQAPATAEATEPGQAKAAAAAPAPAEVGTSEAAAQPVLPANSVAEDEPAGSPAPKVQTEANASPVPQPPSAADAAVSSSGSTAPAVVVAPIGPEIVEAAKAIAGKSTGSGDLAAIASYYTANPDKPLWVGETSLTSRARAVMREIGKADDWGLKSSDFRLPVGDAGPDRGALAKAEARLSLAVLKYARYARGGRIEPVRLSDNLDRKPPLLPPETVLKQIAAASSPADYLRKQNPQHPQFERLRKLYLALKSGQYIAPTAAAEEAAEPTSRKSRKKKAQAKAKPEAITAERVLINMEEWRWMPRDLGAFHIEVNVPEYLLRVVKNGAPIHTERVIVGEPDKQTAIFSDEMESVVFHPGWGVPNSIKVKELLPGLLRGRDTLARNGLRATYRGREVDPSEVNWSRADIRNFDVVQPPGPRNVLGVVKFQFPNKHAIYMHDTPTKKLFNSSVRTFSHGCMRVRNPVALAKMVFAETAGWSPANVDRLIRGGPPDNKVMLQRTIPVHITYFTITVDADGKATAFNDVYRHERLIQLGLDGKTHTIAKKKEDLGAVRARVISSNGGGNSYDFWDERPYRGRRNDDWLGNVFRF
ncbi:MAG: murein L,D-transpeptidase [Hyphomicrobiaceae bacterium]